MVKNHTLLIIASVILIYGICIGTTLAQERVYHLEHEWVKIWVNQNGTIDLLYDINIMLDSGDQINYVKVGQPRGDFTIGQAIDQYGHLLEASDASSGNDYSVRVNLHDPLTSGQTIRFNITTNVAHMVWEDTPDGSVKS